MLRPQLVAVVHSSAASLLSEVELCLLLGWFRPRAVCLLSFSNITSSRVARCFGLKTRADEHRCVLDPALAELRQQGSHRRVSVPTASGLWSLTCWGYFQWDIQIFSVWQSGMTWGHPPHFRCGLAKFLQQNSRCLLLCSGILRSSICACNHLLQFASAVAIGYKAQSHNTGSVQNRNNGAFCTEWKRAVSLVF